MTHVLNEFLIGCQLLCLFLLFIYLFIFIHRPSLLINEGGRKCALLTQAIHQGNNN